MIKLVRAGFEDIPVIQEIAGVTWRVTYSSIIPSGQVDYMLDLFYSATSLKQQLKEGHEFIIVEVDESPMGFASFSPKLTGSPETYRLHKLYINPNCQGKGLGRILIGHVLELIRALGATRLELNVNRANKAIGFYQRTGFSIIREEDIDIGRGYFMNDYVMEIGIV